MIATALLAAAGLPLTLVVMAKVRDRTQSSGQVALGGVITFTLLVVLGVLILTVLPGLVELGARRGGRRCGQRHAAGQLSTDLG